MRGLFLILSLLAQEGVYGCPGFVSIRSNGTGIERFHISSSGELYNEEEWITTLGEGCLENVDIISKDNIYFIKKGTLFHMKNLSETTKIDERVMAMAYDRARNVMFYIKDNNVSEENHLNCDIIERHPWLFIIVSVTIAASNGLSMMASYTKTQRYNKSRKPWAELSLVHRETERNPS